MRGRLGAACVRGQCAPASPVKRGRPAPQLHRQMLLSMTRRASVVLVLISGWTFASPPPDAPVQVPSPNVEVGPGPYNVDLHAASGEFEERYIQAPAGAFTVKGLIQFAAYRTNSRWAPMAAVEVTGPQEDSFFAGLIAFIPNALVMRPSIQFAVREHKFQGAPFAGLEYTDKLIPFELHLDKSGLLHVSVADQAARPVSVRAAEITRVQLVASTADVRFRNIEISVSDR